MIRTSLALALFIALTVPSQASAQDMLHETDYVSVGVGLYDAFGGGDDEDTMDGRLEYRFGKPFFWRLKPFAGVEVTGDGALYGLGGAYFDYPITGNYYVTPSFGAGLYTDGDGKDLGNTLEFRSQIEMGYEFDNNFRLSAALSHISNAGLGDHNPGTEILSAYVHVPLDRYVK